MYSFDFAAGNWVLAKVTNTKRHDNTYVGSVVTVHVGDTRIEATAGHPFWVIEGQNLHERALPHELNEHEDEGQSLAGRWVSSQELKVGDLVIGLDGAAKRVDRLAIREDTALPVSNLSVAQHHSYAVGQAGLLVHNKPAFCTPYRKALARLRDADGTIRIEPPESLLKIAEGPKANGKPRQIHAHHIVMDAIPTDDKGPWVLRSKQLLDRMKISRLEKDADFANANTMDDLANMCWALNNEEDIHQLAYVKKVCERLEAAEKKGATFAQKRSNVLKELNTMAELFANNQRFW